MSFHISGTIGAGMIIAAGVAISIVIDPWPAIFAWLMTLVVLSWPIAWAVRRHRAASSTNEQPATHINVTYQILNLPDQPRSPGEAVYRQLPGPPHTPLEASPWSKIMKSLPSSRTDEHGS